MYSVQECRESSSRMVVNEEDVVNIMAGMQHAGGIKLNDHKRKLKNRSEEQGYPGPLKIKGSVLLYDEVLYVLYE